MITTPETTQRWRAGQTSLASALVNGDWVTAHERMGRNRPAPEAEDHHDQRP